MTNELSGPLEVRSTAGLGAGPDPRWWWKNVHSGSEAIEAARWLLENPQVLTCQDCTLDVMRVCSELIFRVTGEQITPADGFTFDGAVLRGPMDGSELHFSGA